MIKGPAILETINESSHEFNANYNEESDIDSCATTCTPKSSPEAVGEPKEYLKPKRKRRLSKLIIPKNIDENVKSEMEGTLWVQIEIEDSSEDEAGLLDLERDAKSVRSLVQKFEGEMRIEKPQVLQSICEPPVEVKAVQVKRLCQKNIDFFENLCGNQY